MSSIRHSKRIPLVNLDVIGIRPEPVVPDGVWIEIQPCAAGNEAEHNAYFEEERINATNLALAERLIKFQRITQKRVVRAANLQRRNMDQAQSEKMEEEREVLHRSASAAERSTPKKNRCSYNVNPITIDGSGKITSSAQLSASNTKVAAELDLKSDETFNQRKIARQKLAEKLIVPNTRGSKELQDREIPLPGGVWGVGASRDKSSTRIHESHVSINEQNADIPNNNSLLNDTVQTIPAVLAPHDVALASLQESITDPTRKPIRTDLLQTLLSTNCTIDKMNQPLGSEQEQVENLPGHASSHTPHTVHFKLNKDQWKSENITPVEEVTTGVVVTRATRSTGDFPHPTEYPVPRRELASIENTEAPPILRPGVVEINAKKASERARWMSRRVFADAERERAREMLRMKEHKQRVNILKSEKERQRKELEKKSRYQVEAVAVATEQLKKDEIKKESKMRKRKEKEEKRQQKQQRFSVAIRNQLKERVEQNKIELPPLCMCGLTFWDTNPNTCANNCMFYKNDGAYAKALQAVLEAVERNIGPFNKDALQRCAVSLPLVTDDFEDAPPLESARTTVSIRLQLSNAFTFEKL
ncbi:uncharacterized protein LOC100175940 [Ciona intestinalis]